MYLSRFYHGSCVTRWLEGIWNDEIPRFEKRETWGTRQVSAQDPFRGVVSPSPPDAVGGALLTFPDTAQQPTQSDRGQAPREQLRPFATQGTWGGFAVSGFLQMKLEVKGRIEAGMLPSSTAIAT